VGLSATASGAWSFKVGDAALPVRFGFGERSRGAAPSVRSRFAWSPLVAVEGVDPSFSDWPAPLAPYEVGLPLACDPPRPPPRPPLRVLAAFGSGVLNTTEGVYGTFTHSCLPLAVLSFWSFCSLSPFSAAFLRSSLMTVSGVGHDSWSRFGGGSWAAAVDFVLPSFLDSPSALASLRACFSSSRPCVLPDAAVADCPLAPASAFLPEAPPLFEEAPLGREEEVGFGILDLSSSARFFQGLTAGKGASCRGFVTTFLPFLTFSEVFSAGSTDLSTEVDACDLLSHVDSEEALGSEETSSSLVTVEADDAPRSGEDMLDSSTDGVGWAGVGTGAWVWASRTVEVVDCSAAISFSASSAQLGTGPVEPLAAADAVVSFAGVAAPDVGLLDATGVDMPFAACA
jgi:hypothetical protein